MVAWYPCHLLNLFFDANERCFQRFENIHRLGHLCVCLGGGLLRVVVIGLTASRQLPLADKKLQVRKVVGALTTVVRAQDHLHTGHVLYE
jgi:hypothetical protein